MRQKRGQAAVEFLLTYGWAILIVLTAIGALAYMQVLSPGMILPNSCVMGPGFGCKDYKATGSTIEFSIYNGMVHTLSPVEFIFSGDITKCNDIEKPITEDQCSMTSDEFDFSCLTWPGILEGSYTITEAACSEGLCSVSISQPVLGNKQVLHILFRGCEELDGGELSGRQQVEMKVVYRFGGEAYNHNIEGEANLKVEK